jgi:hypothetical protein
MAGERPIDDGDGGLPIDRPIARQCKGHKPDGSRCRGSASYGAVVCACHGASAPQVRNAAARRVAEAQALTVYERYAGPVNGQSGTVDLLHELQRLVAEVVAFKDFAATLVRKLDANGWRALHDPHTAATVGMWERAADRAGRLLVDVSKLGLDLGAGARAREREQMAAEIGDVLGAAMRELGLGLGAQAAVSEAIMRQLRLREGGHSHD